MNIKMVEFIALLGPSFLAEYSDSPALGQLIYLVYFLSLMDWWYDYKQRIIPNTAYFKGPLHYIGNDPVYPVVGKPFYIKFE